MRKYRKVHAKALDSSDIATLSDGALCLFFLLIIAQDDSGYYPWDAAKVRRLMVCRPDWTPPGVDSFGDELVEAGIARWEGGGILLVNGAKLNGVPRKDVEPEHYPRNGVPEQPTAVPPALEGGASSPGETLLALFSGVELAEMKRKFPGVDLLTEAAKCVNWYQDKNRTMKRPRVGFRGWLEAGHRRSGHGNGEPGRHPETGSTETEAEWTERTKRRYATD